MKNRQCGSIHPRPDRTVVPRLALNFLARRSVAICCSTICRLRIKWSVSKQVSPTGASEPFKKKIKKIKKNKKKVGSPHRCIRAVPSTLHVLGEELGELLQVVRRHQTHLGSNWGMLVFLI